MENEKTTKAVKTAKSAAEKKPADPNAVRTLYVDCKADF